MKEKRKDKQVWKSLLEYKIRVFGQNENDSAFFKYIYIILNI